MIENPRIIDDLTLLELQALLEGLYERERQRIQENNIRYGTLTAAIYNSRRTKQSDRVWRWTDFYGDLTKTEAKQDMTTDELYQAFRSMFGGGGRRG